MRDVVCTNLGDWGHGELEREGRLGVHHQLLRLLERGVMVLVRRSAVSRDESIHLEGSRGELPWVVEGWEVVRRAGDRRGGKVVSTPLGCDEKCTVYAGPAVRSWESASGVQWRC